MFIDKLSKMAPKAQKHKGSQNTTWFILVLWSVTMIFAIEYLLRLDTTRNSGEKSNQNLEKDLLAEKKFCWQIKDNVAECNFKWYQQS